MLAATEPHSFDVCNKKSNTWSILYIFGILDIVNVFTFQLLFKLFKTSLTPRLTASHFKGYRTHSASSPTPSILQKNWPPLNLSSTLIFSSVSKEQLLNVLISICFAYSVLDISSNKLVSIGCAHGSPPCNSNNRICSIFSQILFIKYSCSAG